MAERPTYSTAKDLPGELFDKDGNQIFIKGYILGAERDAAQAVARTVAQQELNLALHRATDLAGQEFVDEWLRHAYKSIIEKT